jgi:hypoxanthine-guanine phosphoribosyltransferase
MNMTQNKIKAKLKKLGKAIELDENEIHHSRRMMKTVVCMCIIAGAFALIGLFSSRLEAVGQWYGGASIQDFYMFRGLF